MTEFCRNIVLAVLSLGTLAIVGCTKIFENRRECPVRIYTDFSQVVDEVDMLNLWLEDSEGNSLSRAVSKSEFGHFEEFTLSKGEVDCYAWGNVGLSTVGENFVKGLAKPVLLKRDNEICDRLFFYKANRIIERDSAIFIIRPCRQFASLFMQFTESEEYDEIAVTLHSSTLGFYYDGGIIEGNSRTYAPVVDSKSWLRLLRQSSLSGLAIEITYLYRGESYRYKIDLSEYLSEIGYNMREENLKDIYMVVNLSNFKVAVSIDDWNNLFDVDVEI